MSGPERDPETDDAPRPLLSAGFWAALALGLLLTLAGAAVGLFGAQLFPHPASHAAPHGR